MSTTLEDKMAIVYVVTTGTYSDYQIRAVCSTHELAKEIRILYGRDAAIEEYELDPTPEFQIPSGMKIWFVSMRKDGHVESCRQDCLHVYRLDKDGRFYTRRFGTILELSITWCQAVLAKDEQHAIKIVNEKRAELIANSLWPKDELEDDEDP